MKVILLAAGQGTRTKKLFPDIPKALIPIKGKPAIEYIIEQCKGFDVMLNVRGKDAEKFKYLGLPLLIENTPLGNAGAVKYFSKDLGDKFIATHVDVLSRRESGQFELVAQIDRTVALDGPLHFAAPDHVDSPQRLASDHTNPKRRRLAVWGSVHLRPDG